MSALDRSDLGLGCSHCAWQQRLGTSHLAFARRYDSLPLARPEDEMVAWPAQIEFALSNTCNLQCVQCTGQFSSAIRSQREQLPPLPRVYGDEFFEQLTPFLDHVQVVRFTGGEPFLSRSNQRVWDLMLQSDNRPACHLVTNATQWDARVEDILERLRFEVTVSLDALDPAVLAQTRVGIDPDSVLANIERYGDLATRIGVRIGLSYCMMTTTWQEFGAIVRYADAHHMVVDCSVVTFPEHLSLHRLGRPALTAVVEALEREDQTLRPLLTLNREIWVAELERLRATLDEDLGAAALAFTDQENRAFRRDMGGRAITEAESPVSIVFTKPVRSKAPRVRSTGPTPEADAAEYRRLREWTGNPTDNILRGTIVDDIMVAVSSDQGVPWLEPEDVIGLPATTCQDRIVDLLGTPGVPTFLEQSETRVDQVILYRAGDDAVEVRIVMMGSPYDGSEVVTIDTWMARRPAPTDPAPLG